MPFSPNDLVQLCLESLQDDYEFEPTNEAESSEAATKPRTPCTDAEITSALWLAQKVFVPKFNEAPAATPFKIWFNIDKKSFALEIGGETILADASVINDASASFSFSGGKRGRTFSQKKDPNAPQRKQDKKTVNEAAISPGFVELCEQELVPNSELITEDDDTFDPSQFSISNFDDPMAFRAWAEDQILNGTFVAPGGKGSGKEYTPVPGANANIEDIEPMPLKDGEDAHKLYTDYFRKLLENEGYAPANADRVVTYYSMHPDLVEDFAANVVQRKLPLESLFYIGRGSKDFAIQGKKLAQILSDYILPDKTLKALRNYIAEFAHDTSKLERSSSAIIGDGLTRGIRNEKGELVQSLINPDYKINKNSDKIVFSGNTIAKPGRANLAPSAKESAMVALQNTKFAVAGKNSRISSQYVFKIGQQPIRLTTIASVKEQAGSSSESELRSLWALIKQVYLSNTILGQYGILNDRTTIAQIRRAVNQSDSASSDGYEFSTLQRILPLIKKQLRFANIGNKWQAKSLEGDDTIDKTRNNALSLVSRFSILSRSLIACLEGYLKYRTLYQQLEGNLAPIADDNKAVDKTSLHKQLNIAQANATANYDRIASTITEIEDFYKTINDEVITKVNLSTAQKIKEILEPTKQQLKIKPDGSSTLLRTLYTATADNDRDVAQANNLAILVRNITSALTEATSSMNSVLAILRKSNDSVFDAITALKDQVMAINLPSILTDEIKEAISSVIKNDHGRVYSRLYNDYEMLGNDSYDNGTIVYYPGSINADPTIFAIPESKTPGKADIVICQSPVRYTVIPGTSSHGTLGSWTFNNFALLFLRGGMGVQMVNSLFGLADRGERHRIQGILNDPGHWTDRNLTRKEIKKIYSDRTYKNLFGLETADDLASQAEVAYTSEMNDTGDSNSSASNISADIVSIVEAVSQEDASKSGHSVNSRRIISKQQMIKAFALAGKQYPEAADIIIRGSQVYLSGNPPIGRAAKAHDNSQKKTEIPVKPVTKNTKESESDQPKEDPKKEIKRGIVRAVIRGKMSPSGARNDLLEQGVSWNEFKAYLGDRLNYLLVNDIKTEHQIADIAKKFGLKWKMSEEAKQQK